MRSKLRFETEALKIFTRQTPLKPRAQRGAVCCPVCRIVSRTDYLNLRPKFRRSGSAQSLFAALCFKFSRQIYPHKFKISSKF
ncbi:MAG: hypothetical protein D8H92_13000 [Campylobacter sp.]|nr:MAG: hypothetical protein D8H92_13000 [Campylobacter sp.]